MDSLWSKPQGSPRILKWVAYPFSRGSSQSRNWNRISYIAGWFFTSWATREAIWKIICQIISYSTKLYLASQYWEWAINTRLTGPGLSGFSYSRREEEKLEKGLYAQDFRVKNRRYWGPNRSWVRDGDGDRWRESLGIRSEVGIFRTMCESWC